jgi:multiple sugar transport system permease protein
MKRKNFSYAKYGYIFCIPFVLVYLVFSLYPLLYTVTISITDREGPGVLDRDAEFGIQTRTLYDEDKIPFYEQVGKNVTTETIIPIIDYDTRPRVDENGARILDEEGNSIYEVVGEIPRRDHMGNLLYIIEGVPRLNRDGNPDSTVILDGHRNPIPYVLGAERTDGHGNTVIFFEEWLRATDEHGNPAYREIRVDRLDANGNPITVLDPLQNFRTVMNSDRFRTAITTTFRIWLVNFIPQIILAVALAAWFTSRHSKVKGQGLFKVIFYMPNIITAGTIAVLFSALFDFPSGVVNDTLRSIGFLENAINFADTAPNAQRNIVSFIQFWMWYGYTMLIFISGILGLNPEMFESADIDGAGSVKQFFYITLPNLRTIAIFMVVSSLIGGFNMFDIPLLYSEGGPAGATTTTSIWIYQQAFDPARRFNTASAASVIMFLIIAVLSAIIFFIMRDKEEVRLRKYKKAEAKALKQAMKGVD